MPAQARGITGVLQIARQQRQRQPELPDLRPTHFRQAVVLHEPLEIVVQHRGGLVEAPPLQVGVQGTGKGVLKAVVLVAVVVALHRAVLGVVATGAHHQFARKRKLRHVVPAGIGQLRLHRAAECVLPVRGKIEQRRIELLGTGLATHRAERGVAVGVVHRHDLPTFHLHGAVPGLHHEAIGGAHIGKHQHVVPRIGFAIVAHDLAHCGHPAAEHAFLASLDQRLVAQRGKGVFRARGAAAAVGQDGHGVERFARADKGGPRPAPAIVLGIEQGGRRWRHVAHLRLVRVAIAQQAVGEQIRFGHRHLGQRQAEIRLTRGGIGRLGALVQAQHAAVGPERQLALRVVEMLADGPVLLEVAKPAQRAANMRRRRQRFQARTQRHRRGVAGHRSRYRPGTRHAYHGGGGNPLPQKRSTVHRCAPFES